MNKFPHQFIIVNTRLNTKKRDSNFLFITLYCKWITDKDFNDQDIRKMNKFIINLPIAKFISLTLSTIVFLKEMCTKCVKVKKFFETIKPFEYYNQGNYITNHLLICLTKYMICTKKELEIVNSVQSLYKCFVNSYFHSNEDLVFFIQNNFNAGGVFNFYNIYNFLETSEKSLNFKYSDEKKYINSNIKYYEFTLYVGHMKRKDINFEKLNFDFKKTYNDQLQNIYRLMKPFDISKELYNKVELNVLCYDIEVGWINATENETEFINPFKGYIQCIAIITTKFLKEYKNDKINKIIMVYLPDNVKDSNICDGMNINGNWKVVLFNSEIKMIEYFFYQLTKFDICIGYNIKSFDHPFLINRYNILKSKNIKDLNYINSIILDGNWDFKFSTQFISSVVCKCKCGKDVKKNNNDDNFLFMCSCGCIFDSKMENLKIMNIKKNYLESNSVFLLDLYNVDELKMNVENGKLETVCNFNFKKMIKNYRKLDRENLYFVVLKDKFKNDLSFKNFCEIYTENIKCVGFRMNSVSNEITNKINFILDKVLMFEQEDIDINDVYGNWDNFIKIEKYAHVNVLSKESQKWQNRETDLFCGIFLKLKNCKEIVDLKSLNFLSIGKTSDLTLSEQQNWKNEYHVLKTLEYCSFDTLLTMNLEYILNSLVDIERAYDTHLPLFTYFSLKAPQLSEYITLYDLYKTNIIFSHKSFSQYSLFFNISIECKTLKYLYDNNPELLNHDDEKFYKMDNDVKLINDDEILNSINKEIREEYSYRRTFKPYEQAKKKYDQMAIEYPFYKIDCVNNVLDLFTNVRNIDEVGLGIVGESNMANIDKLKEEVKNL